MVALDLALGHRVIRFAAGMCHAVLGEPGPELSGRVGRAVVAQRPPGLPSQRRYAKMPLLWSEARDKNPQPDQEDYA